MNRDNEDHTTHAAFWRSRYALGSIVIGGVAGFSIFTQIRVHSSGSLPYLLLLACPVMHVFTHHDDSAYGLWGQVFLNSVVFIIFAFSFFKPATARAWAAFGALTVFIVALFGDLNGFPLTIYRFSDWVQTYYPRLDILTHGAWHLSSTLAGEKGDSLFIPFPIASYLFLSCSFYLLSNACPMTPRWDCRRWEEWAKQ